MSGLRATSASNKTLRICPAYLQGLPMLRRHFQRKKALTSDSPPLFF
jgi:hypothetical protein